MYLSEVAQADDGTLSLMSTKPVEFPDVGGLWVPCAGSVTPWGTHLDSEEYPADAQAIEAATSIDEIDDYNIPMVAFFGVDPTSVDLDTFRAVYKPSRYGFPVEISVGESGDEALRDGPRGGRAGLRHARGENGLHLGRRHQCRHVQVRGRHRRRSLRGHAPRPVPQGLSASRIASLPARSPPVASPIALPTSDMAV